MKNVTPTDYYDHPEEKLYCWNCDERINYGNEYIDMNGKPYCKPCFYNWLDDHRKYNE